VKCIVSNLHYVLLLLLVLTALAVAGCATPSENVSERPWNTPQGWETGIPSGMYNNYR